MGKPRKLKPPDDFFSQESVQLFFDAFGDVVGEIKSSSPDQLRRIAEWLYSAASYLDKKRGGE